MRTILLPTDFKKHSEKAMSFAINIAKRANAKIIVTNCFFIPNVDINIPVDILEDLYLSQRKASEKALTQWCQEISSYKNSLGESIQTEFIADQNIPSAKILALIDEKEISLIVMGVENKKHLLNLLGSTALDVSSKAHCPVLLVHEKSEYSYFNKVFFAIENVKEDLIKIKQMIPFLRPYDSEISVLHIDPLPKNTDALEAMLCQKSEYDSLLNRIMKKYRYYPNVHFHYNVSDETFKKMDLILRTEKPDLLVLIYKERPFTKSIFHKSVIKEIIKKKDTPLLIIH